MQVIKNLGNRKFRTYWTDVNNSELYMDFDPIIRLFGLTGNFVLLHWQAKPFGYRRWGAYDSATDDYCGFNYDQLRLSGRINMTTLQIDEKKWKVKPTAALLIPNTILLSQQGNVIIQGEN